MATSSPPTSGPGTTPVSLELLFRGDSELARRMRAFDWSKSDVGPPEGWPQNLRVALGICLTSRFPMHVWWGRALTLFYNDAYVSFLGSLKHPAVLGRPGPEAWSEIWPTIGPMIREVFASGKASWSEDILMFFDRDVPKEEVYVTFSFSPIHGNGKEVDGLFCACTEVTDKLVSNRRLETLRKLGIRAAEAQSVDAACQKSAEVLATNPHDIPFAAIYVANHDGTRAALSATAGLFEAHSLPRGVSIEAGDISSWPLASVLGSRRAEALALDAVGLELPGAPWPEPATQAVVLPIPGVSRDKIAGLLVVGVSPRRVLDSRYLSFFDLVAGQIGTAISDAEAHDVSARRKLMEANRAKDEFIAMLGHELRNPLSPILTALELLRMRGTECHELAIIERQTAHLVRLVDDLLDISRITRGKIELRKTRFELATVVMRAVEMASPLLEQRSQQLDLQIPPQGLVVEGDPERLAQVASNLLTNAAKYSEPGTHVHLHAAERGSSVILRVRDEGMGIPKDMLGRIFDMFVQEPQALDRSKGGLGLGLAIVKSLVELHGGTVTAESEGVGRGSEFVVELPLAKGHELAEGPTRWRASIVSPIEPPPAPHRILVVDDNDDTTETIAAVLSEVGYDVATAHDGPSALETALRFRPDICLLDIGLPVMDGYELARRLRELETLPRDVRLVAITGYGTEADRRRSEEAGFNTHLVKPVDLDVLMRVVAN